MTNVERPPTLSGCLPNVHTCILSGQKEGGFEPKYRLRFRRRQIAYIFGFNDDEKSVDEPSGIHVKPAPKIYGAVFANYKSYPDDGLLEAVSFVSGDSQERRRYQVFFNKLNKLFTLINFLMRRIRYL
jgi:hypothetical protein